MAEPQLSQQAVLDSISQQLSVILSQRWSAKRVCSELKDLDSITEKMIPLYYLKYVL